MNNNTIVGTILEFNQEKNSDKNAALESTNYEIIIKELTKEINNLKERLEKTEWKLNIHINEHENTAHKYQNNGLFI